MNKNRTISIVLSVVVVGGGLLYLLTSSFDESMIYYKTVDELLSQKARFQGKPIRINGLLVPGSIKRKPNTDQFRFQISKRDQTLDVAYAGILPDAMQEGKELIIHGVLEGRTGLFNASEILTKCPSKYESKAQSLGP